MKNIAAWIIVIILLWGMVFFTLTSLVGAAWKSTRSPITSICYEVRTMFWTPGIGQAMSPIDDSYCDQEHERTQYNH